MSETNSGSHKIDYDGGNSKREESIASILSAFIKSTGAWKHRVAHDLNIPPWRLSTILSNVKPPDDEILERIAALVGRPFAELRKIRNGTGQPIK